MKAIVLTTWDRLIVDDIIDMAETFIKETKFPVTFDRSKVYDRIHTAFFSDDGDVILAIDDNGGVVGGAVVWASADWQVEKFGYVEKFFVRSGSRGRGVGRLIAERSARWFDEKDCVFSFATSTANIGAGRLFVNLMAKYGYQDIGPTLSRRKS